MITVGDIAAAVEQSAPLWMQENYDNAGLIVGDSNAAVNSVLLCVDITEEVMDEAEELGVAMVLSHHPVIFHGLKRLTPATYVERVVARAIRSGIALYSAHTNLDSTPHFGLSHEVGRMLGLKNTVLLEPSRQQDPDVGFGVVGELETDMEPKAFILRVKKVLRLDACRHSDIYISKVRRVAVCTGSGSSLMGAAKRAAADVYVAADFKYNDFLNADREMVIVDAGHFETEYCAIGVMFDIITKKFPNFAVHKSRNSRNPVNYLY